MTLNELIQLLTDIRDDPSSPPNLGDAPIRLDLAGEEDLFLEDVIAIPDGRAMYDADNHDMFLADEPDLWVHLDFTTRDP